MCFSPIRLVPVALLSLGACVGFPAARSAEVRPGPSVEFATSLTTSPHGTSRCLLSVAVTTCSTHQMGASAGLTYGWERTPTRRGSAVSAGMSMGNSRSLGYLDGYWQLQDGPRARGIGLRTAIDGFGWGEHQIYARFDRALPNRSRLLWNPSLLALSGRQDSLTAGSFVGLANSIGLSAEGGFFAGAISITLVAGRGQGRYGSRGRSVPFGPEWAVFGGVGVVYTVPVPPWKLPWPESTSRQTPRRSHGLRSR